MSARDELLCDLFTTALEGGINYWARCMDYRWSTGDGATADLQGYYADIIDLADGDEENEERRYIDREVMARGYRLATSGERVIDERWGDKAKWRDTLHWSSGEKPPLFITDDTDWDFDAGDADMIVQLGLFGEVVYG